MLVQEDLAPAATSRPSSRRRQIDDLTTKQRSADALIHKLSSVAHANMIAVEDQIRHVAARKSPRHRCGVSARELGDLGIGHVGGVSPSFPPLVYGPLEDGCENGTPPVICGMSVPVSRMWA